MQRGYDWRWRKLRNAVIARDPICTICGQAPSTDAAHIITWSPDASRIAFVSDRDGNFDIYAINADGSGLTRLTDDPVGAAQPAWSPVQE